MVDVMMTQEEIVETLRTSDIGEGLPDSVLANIANLAEILTISPGEALTEEGADGHHAYIIVSGSIEVQINTTDPLNPAGSRTLHPGSIIGEMSILESSKRTARTVALETCSLLCIRDQDLWGYFDTDPQAGYTFMRNLAKILSHRLRVTNLAIRHSFFV